VLVNARGNNKGGRQILPLHKIQTGSHA
jgi:hypothetical protein